MRLFLALDLPEPLLGALLRLQQDLGLGRPLPEENLHLTLAFLGECSAEAAAQLDEALCASPLPGAHLRPQGLELFGGAQGRALAATFAREPGLEALHARARGAARLAGVELPRRRFRPHVTLARLPARARGPDALRLRTILEARPKLPAAAAERAVLYRSYLGGGPARHEALAQYPLPPAPG